MRVFVLSSDKQPLDPCHSARARMLLSDGSAKVFKRFPFTIILQERTRGESTVHEHRLKIDPGSKVTGVAIIQEAIGQVVAAVEITHRGQRIRDAMYSRAALRRGRRSRKTRYRAPRFNNRTRRKGWMPPSLESRVANIETWVRRFRKLCPIAALSMEFVRFDMQLMQNSEINGVQYQQGELAGYEVREYLLEKWGRKCAYCGKDGVPLQVEHIEPRCRGGSDRVSNLCIACEPCNTSKGSRLIEDFLCGKSEILKRIKLQAKSPLRDAAAVNSTRWELWRRLNATGLPLEIGTGGLTKFNRVSRGFQKAHWLDAVCVGVSTPQFLSVRGLRCLAIKATGHGCRQRCRTNKFGFPTCHARGLKKFQGFQTGDIVLAVVPSGKHKGKHCGRVAIRFHPQFRLNGFDVNSKCLVILQQCDGYDYGLMI